MMTLPPTTEAHPGDPTPPRADEAGFTWAEFALVTLIVVVLVAMASWGIGGIREQTRDSFCQSSLRSLKLAVGEYEAANDRPPVDNQVLVDGGYADGDDILGHTVSVEPGSTEAIYTPRGRCD